MDYIKTREFDNFLCYKNTRIDNIFFAKVEIYQFAEKWLTFNSEIQIQNDYNVDDYKIIFMNELLITKPYLGQAIMGVNFLRNISFKKPYLYFTTSDGKKVRLS